MFRFFEAYNAKAWKGLVKRGFINAYTGLRFVQEEVPNGKKFNDVAKEGGEFFNIAKELKAPIHVDRLQGGECIEEYPYDEKLIHKYEELLGNNFWGFQMHEWLSNLRNDLKKIRSGGCQEWTVEEIEKSIRKQFPETELLFLEGATAQEFADYGEPKSAEEFLRFAKAIYEKRQKKYTLIPCDSAYLPFQYEIKQSAGKQHKFMIEIGAQVPDMRLQFAYARGMARAYDNASFGAYYEPWGGDPFSACCYNKNKDNEWGLNDEKFPFKTEGENGGSSRSLQRRCYLYSYFSGADFISEEWGLCNTFYDWQDFEISPYGQIKKDFMALVDKYQDAGERITLVAVVLPKDMDAVTIKTRWMHPDEEPFGYKLELAQEKRYVQFLEKINKIFSASTEMSGNEYWQLINSDVPDAFDVVHSDCSTLANYPWLVDLSNGEIPSALKGRVVSVEESIAIVKKQLPCVVKGNCHWFVNECKDGSKLLVVFNNDGIVRSVKEGEYALPEATTRVSVSIKDGGALQRLEGSRGLECRDGEYLITIAPGDWFLARF